MEGWNVVWHSTQEEGRDMYQAWNDLFDVEMPDSKVDAVNKEYWKPHPGASLEESDLFIEFPEGRGLMLGVDFCSILQKADVI
jgi:hypothetical protein